MPRMPTVSFSRVATITALAALWMIVLKLYSSPEIAGALQEQHLAATHRHHHYQQHQSSRASADLLMLEDLDDVDDAVIRARLKKLRLRMLREKAAPPPARDGADDTEEDPEEPATNASTTDTSSAASTNRTNGDAAAAPAASVASSPGNETVAPFDRVKAACGEAFDGMAFQAQVERQDVRYLFTENMRTGYGFTNQLLVYAALLQYGIRDRRRVVFPFARVGFHRLVDLEASKFKPNVTVSDPICEATAVDRYYPSTRMKSTRFDPIRKALPRGRVASDPTGSMDRYYSFMHSTRQSRNVRLWEMYGRWPYGAEFLPSWMTFPWFLCSIRFSDRIEQLAERLYFKFAASALKFHASIATEATAPPTAAPGAGTSAMRQRNVGYAGSATHARYVAVHLRMEPQDMHSMGRSWSNATQVAQFMEETVMPLALSFGTRSLVICSGKLDGEVEAYMEALAVFHGFQILRKTDFGNITFGNDEKMIASEYSGRKLVPTSTEGAATDLLLIERAVAVVATSFSSFTSGVYGRRCCEAFTEIGAANYSAAESPFAAFGGGPQRGNIFLYEVYRDGSITEAAEYPCGHQLGDYVKGRTVPAAPAGKELFTMGFNRSNPLFAAHPERNDGPIIFPPNVERYRSSSVIPKGANPIHFHGGGQVVQIGKRFGAGGKYMRVKKRI